MIFFNYNYNKKYSIYALFVFILFFLAFYSIGYTSGYPIGTFEAVDDNRCEISGWAKDPDTTNSIYIHIYKDGPFWSGTFIDVIKADLLRSDLPYFDKNHGFVYKFDFSSGLYDGKDHKIYVYGIDETGDSNAELNLSPKIIRCKPPELNFVNVKDYGAKGDGFTDDSMAIQNAIDSLSPAGGTVYVPTGTYMLGSANGSLLNYPNGQPILCALKITKDNVIFRGDGGGSILKLMANKKMRVLCSTGNNNIIEKIVIDGNATQRISRDSAGKLHSWPDGYIVDGLLYLFGSNNSIVRNCEVRNGLEDGIGTWQTRNSLIQDCYIHDNGGYALDPVNLFEAGANGIALNAGFGDKAINNKIERNTYGILMAYGEKNATIDSNIISNNYGFGIQIGSTFFEQNGNLLNSDFVITNNVIQENGAGGFSGIYIFGAQNGKVSNNKIINNLNVGLSIDDENNFLTYNSKNWEITNNICSNTTFNRFQKIGIYITGRAQNINLNGNICRDNGLSINDQIVITNYSAVNSNWQSVNTISYIPTSSLDIIPPTTPNRFTARVISSNQIDLSWSASTDNVGVAGYKIYRDEILIATTSLTTYSDKNLSPSTTYTYAVSAYDTTGNNSLKSSGVSVTTPPNPTSTPKPTSTYFTVLSPNGGENLVENQYFTIRWSGGPSSDTAIINLIAPNFQPGWVYKIAEVPNNDIYNWKVNYPLSSLGVDYHGAPIFKINITLKNNGQYGDSSDGMFSIISQPTSTICQDTAGGTPLITSLSTYSGPVGTKLEIKGCNLYGFEGEKNVWIENELGIKGILYGEAGSTSEIIKVTLNSPLCQKDISYSGLPCDAWLTLSPGKYKIYVMPWGKKSNEINFTITQTETDTTQTNTTLERIKQLQLKLIQLLIKLIELLQKQKN